MHLRYIAVENIVRKGEISCNNVFYPYMALIFHFKCNLRCHLKFVSVWTSLKFCSLVMGFPVLRTIFFPSHWLLSHITIVETMDSGKREMNQS